jgi:hypothetical protein
MSFEQYCKEEHMADLNDTQGNVTIVSRPHWGAIWAGMFTFIAIWSVFIMLGAGIFATSASSAPTATGGLSLGMAVWSVILTLIAMFVAGQVTGRLAGITNSRDGMIHGMVMFGLSVAAALVIGVIGNSTQAGAADASTPYLFAMFANWGWTLFASLFLGWLAAMGGASTAHREFSTTAVQQHARA